MDIKFKLFEDWYKFQIGLWKSKDIEIENTYYCNNERIHTYRIEIKSKNGFGEICLYESNNIYWVDFDACVEINSSFGKCNITDKSIFLDAYNKFMEYLTVDVIDKSYFKDCLCEFIRKD